jgi:ferredoxin
MKAVVDPEICIGCTLCTQICPEVFKMQGEKAVAYVSLVPAEAEAAAQDAIDQCPVNAIRSEP